MFEIKVNRRPHLGSLAFSEEQMRVLGETDVSAQLSRIHEARNVDDEPAKPLTPIWAKVKAKKGLPPVRDLHYSGAMLSSLGVKEAEQNVAVVSVSEAEKPKLAANQRIDRMFGLAHSDREEVVKEARAEFTQNVKSLLK